MSLVYAQSQPLGHRSQHSHCERCAELEEQVAYLKGELGQQVDDTYAGDVRTAFGITRKESAILAKMMRAYPRPVQRWSLAEDDLETDVEHTRNLVSVYITRLRRKLGGDHMIETVRHVGYRLTDDGHDAVSQQLRHVAPTTALNEPLPRYVESRLAELTAKRLSTLTLNQRAVLTALASGRTVGQVAKERGVSHEAVSRMRRTALEKMERVRP